MCLQRYGLEPTRRERVTDSQESPPAHVEGFGGLQRPAAYDARHARSSELAARERVAQHEIAVLNSLQESGRLHLDASLVEATKDPQQIHPGNVAPDRRSSRYQQHLKSFASQRLRGRVDRLVVKLIDHGEGPDKRRSARDRFLERHDAGCPWEGGERGLRTRSLHDDRVVGPAVDSFVIDAAVELHCDAQLADFALEPRSSLAHALAAGDPR